MASLRHWINDFIVFLLLLVIVTHVLKILYLLFRPKWLSRIPYFADTSPGKTQLLLHYILTTVVAAYALSIRF
jgi:hypothetical protein